MLEIVLNWVPVKNAAVTYYIYRSRYYPWWWDRDEDEEQAENEGGQESGYGYGNRGLNVTIPGAGNVRVP